MSFWSVVKKVVFGISDAKEIADAAGIKLPKNVDKGTKVIQVVKGKSEDR